MQGARAGVGSGAFIVVRELPIVPPLFKTALKIRLIASLTRRRHSFCREGQHTVEKAVRLSRFTHGCIVRRTHALRIVHRLLELGCTLEWLDPF